MISFFAEYNEVTQVTLGAGCSRSRNQSQDLKEALINTHC